MLILACIAIVGYAQESGSVKGRLLEGNIPVEKPFVDLDSISMEADTVMLGVVTISAQRKIIQKTPEGFILNAASNITQTGGTATDLLRSTPTVNVDEDGNITLRGKTPLILINGRNSSMTNTDQIAASSVESIEIINNPSAKYDASAESGIINIKLKKNKKSGTSGGFAVGAGFGARGRANSTLFLSHKSDKWNLGMAYDNRFAGRRRTIEGNRTNFNIFDEHQLNQERHDKNFDQLQNLKLNADYTPDSKNLFSFEAIGNLAGHDNHESLDNAWFTQDNLLNSKWNRFSKEIERGRVAEFALNYNRKYADERRNLLVGVNTSFERGRQNTDITTHTLDENNMFIGDPYFGRTHDYGNTNITNAIVSYTFPVTANIIMETGYKGLFRTTNDDFLTAEKVGNEYIVDSRVTDIFHFYEQVHAAYLQLNGYKGNKDNPKWRYNAGIRAEQVFNHGDMQAGNTSFKNSYIHFFPSANVTYYLNPDEFWKLSYGKRINYPHAEQLCPFVDITDSLNQHGGNPNLKPEIIHSFELGYNKDWKSYSISSVLFFRYAEDVIQGYSELLPGGIIISRPMNFGSATRYGWENIFYMHPVSFYDATLSVSLYQQNINGTISGNNVSNNGFCWYGKLINNFNWNNSKFQLIGNYNSPTVSPQGRSIAVSYIDMGFQQQLGKNTHISLVVTDIFNTLKYGNKLETPDFRSSRIAKIDTRAVLLTFAHTFNSAFKEKLLENKFSEE